MGGGSYDRDVETGSSISADDFNFIGEESSSSPQRLECHPDLDIKDSIRECCESEEHPVTTPIVIAMDLTRSRGKDILEIYKKIPLLIGQVEMNNYAAHPELCIIGIGDATSGDHVPLQISQFESDMRIDDNLHNLIIEEGGGGTGQESYELVAYAMAEKSKLDANKRGKKGYFFFIGDEGFYPTVSKDQIKVLIGDEVIKDVPSEVAFRKLQEKYHVFFIFPKKSWKERKDDIDEEIKQRVEQAGGMIEGVSVRGSLLWNDYNDLDLHCICPSGDHIYYGNKHSRCKGYLDVDRNANGRETRKPVENIRWAKDQAPAGKYKFFVRTYAYHERQKGRIPWRAEVEIDGKVHHFEGVNSPRGATGESSDKLIMEFDYDPNAGGVQEDEDKYTLYNDEIVTSQWASVLPEEHILILEDPAGVMDLILGTLVVKEEDNGVSLDEYIKHMDSRDQTKTRQRQTKKSLKGLVNSLSLPKVDSDNLPDKKTKRRKKKKTKRL